jgi:hypothetical protein
MGAVRGSAASTASSSRSAWIEAARRRRRVLQRKCIGKLRVVSTLRIIADLSGAGGAHERLAAQPPG